MKKLLITLILCLTFFFALATAEEGMYPISEIHKLDLQKKGLEMSPLEMYNPDGISLIDGICKVGGCTGSFVSKDGLILTNHHCAYGAVQRASTKKNDYLQNGFLAKTRGQEIPAKAYTVRITESYRDVSEEVLSAVSEKMDFAERTKAIEKRTKEIVKQAEKDNPGKRAEVSEMFIGKTYVLFIYTYLKDLRLVYAPPRSIGNFGGEVDNWMWPRHTGDFSFMRAYVAPDGSSADYSPDNVPYQPKRVVKVAPEGVNEEDFVFILGYPGRTYRHRTSHFLAYEEEIRMPYVVDWYQWQIDVMEKMGEKDRAVQLKHIGAIKGLSNTMKNYRGKLKGLKRMQLVDKKREEEKALEQFINSDPKRKNEYGSLLSEIDKVYKELREQADLILVLTYLRRSSQILSFASTVYEASIELQKDDLERKGAYMNRTFDRTKQRLTIGLKNYYVATDKIIFKKMLKRAAKLPEKLQIPAIKKLIGNKDPETAINEFFEKAYAQSKLYKKNILDEALKKSPKQVKKMKDPFIQLTIELYPTFEKFEEQGKARRGKLDKLYAKLIDVKKQFKTKDFIPDANRTLRLTYGRIRGYSPYDAVYMNPITSTNGVLEKSTGNEPFDTPAKLLKLIKAKDYGKFYHKKLDGVPVGILYNMDTTGGNSGSPVLNARGELVGINFDRAFEATINDYAWSESYSRSIAVDIRYVLWVTQKFGGATHLLKEIGVL
ncbi:S46 family peptidase [candidate division KSB1 bacterium]|nr:S46 family peptidase [candidate division KSB1 bacterium]MBL7094885.1 S46 family peptidase [candidate division KSB1 bacterium]